MTMDEWSAALDALEEWVRRTAAGLALSEPEPPVEAPVLPAGPVPADLQLRAQLLVSSMHNVEKDVLRRRDQLSRAQAYGAA